MRNLKTQLTLDGVRTLIVGDIHANLEAFQTVLRGADTHGGFQELWCLGDVVGYGPDPGPCVDLLSNFSPLAVAGNHDRAAVGLMGLEEFNPYAAEACRWTSANLTVSQTAYLQGLSLVCASGGFTLVHGSLRDPIWEYLVHQEAARATFRLLQTERCLVAHSHVPFICYESIAAPAFQLLRESVALPLGGSGRVIINPGSVGQPRDGDPRAAYILYDSDADSITFYRVAYDISVTQEKMRKANLPGPLIERLAVGR